MAKKTKYEMQTAQNVSPAMRRTVHEGEFVDPAQPPGQASVNEVNIEANQAPQPPSEMELLKMAAMGLDPAMLSSSNRRSQKVSTSEGPPLVFSPEQMRQIGQANLAGAIQAKQQGEQEMQANRDIQAQLSQMVTPAGGPNYGGMLGMFDALLGGKTNFLKDYKSPETKRKSELQSLLENQQKLALLAKGFSAEEADRYKDLMAANNAAYMAESQANRGQDQWGRFGLARKGEFLDKIRSQIDKDVTEPVAKDLLSIDTAINSIKSGNLQDIKNVKAMLARMMGHVGVLNDTDVKDFMPPTIATSRAELENWLSSDASAKMAPGLQRQLLGLATRQKQRMYEKYKDILDTHSAAFGTTDLYGLMQPGAMGDNTFKEQQKLLQKKFKIKPEMSEEDFMKLSKEEKDKVLKEMKGQ